MKTKFYTARAMLALAMALSLSLASASGAAASKTKECLPPPAGMTGWWTGDGNTDDLIGGRNALLHGDAVTGKGLVDQAFILDGDGDFVSVPHDPALNLGTGDFTIDLWVYFNTTAGEQVLIEKWVQGGVGPSIGWTLTKLEENAIRLAMASGDGGEINVDSAPLSIPVKTWIHFAATRKAGEIQVFMNGKPIATGESPNNLDSVSSLKFGHRGNPSDTPGSEDESGFFLNGRIDEVELFVGRALPPKVIQAIYNAGSAGKCKDGFSAPTPYIVASVAGDWFWTTGFDQGRLNLSIFESAAEDAKLLWQGSRKADEAGFVIVFFEDHGLDLLPGNLVVVSDGATEKRLVLELITMEVFDTENEIMAGTAPVGREVVVVAGMAEAETQGVIFVIADPQSGAWSADFTSIGFDITEEMRPWSFAQIHDEDGDANEAGPPAME